AGATVNVSGTSVTASAANVVNGTTITTTLTITAGAQLGLHDVSVTTTGGTSNTAAFTVNPPAPTLASVAPPSGVAGTAVPVTLSGTNFVAGATVNVSGTGVTASAANVVNGTTITTTLTVTAGAQLGSHDVSVTTTGGTSNTAAFTVNPPAPTLASVAPPSGVAGTA